MILTGFSEFEYAKTAISMGVDGYLLKPIDEDELLDYVEKIRGELEEHARLSRYHEKNEEKARQELLRRIVLNEGKVKEWERELEIYHLPFNAGSVFCTAICKEDEAGLEKGGKMLSAKVERLVENDSSCMGMVSMEDQVVLIGQGVEYGQWKEKLSKRCKYLESYFGSGLKIAIGNNVRNWRELFCSYESASYLMEQEFIFDHEDILTIDLICNLEGNQEAVTVEWMEMLVEVGEEEGIKRAMGLLREYCTWHLFKESEIKLMLIQDLIQIQMRLSKKYPSSDFSNDELQQRLKRLMAAEDMKSLLQFYEKTLTEFGKKIGVGGGGNIIRRVYYYMEKNYHKDLKLENIAKNFNYNSAYLGKLFRKEMGETFNNSLDRIRITNARRLLEETDLKVYQISEQVGYSSIDYFYMKFKKYVGISPKEYRKNKNVEM